jgi:hypothetical protein
MYKKILLATIAIALPFNLYAGNPAPVNIESVGGYAVSPSNGLPVTIISGSGGSSTAIQSFFYAVTKSFTDSKAGVVPISTTQNGIALEQDIIFINGVQTSVNWYVVSPNVRTAMANPPPDGDVAQQTSTGLTNAELRASPVVVSGLLNSQLALDNSVQTLATIMNGQTNALPVIDANGKQWLMIFNSNINNAFVSVFYDFLTGTTGTPVMPIKNYAYVDANISGGTVKTTSSPDTSTSSLALENGGHLASLDTKITNGIKAMANSVPVTIASDQSSVNVSVTNPTSSNTTLDTSYLIKSNFSVGSVNLVANVDIIQQSQIIAPDKSIVGTMYYVPTQQVYLVSAPDFAKMQAMLPSTSALQSSLDIDGGSLSHITNFPTNQVVSGTVTANIGTAGNLALDSSVKSLITAIANTIAVNVNSSALPTGASTSVLQTAANTSLATIANNTAGLATDSSIQTLINTVKSTVNLTGTVWYDPTKMPVTYYIRRETVNEGTGAVTVTWWTPQGTSANPTYSNLQAVSNAQNIADNTTNYQATDIGTGYSKGDILIHNFGTNTTTNPPSLAYSYWLNATAGNILTTPPALNTYSQSGLNITAQSLPLPANASQETGGNLDKINSKLPALNGDGGVPSHVNNFPSNQNVTLDSANTTSLSTIATNTTNAMKATGGTVGLVAGSATIGSVNVLGGNTQAIKVDNSGVTQPISGSVTVNAGTNTSTASLALETGGNLAGINTKLNIDGSNNLKTTNTSIGATASAIPSFATLVGISSGGFLTGLSYGQGTKNYSLPVTVASDDSVNTYLSNLNTKISGLSNLIASTISGSTTGILMLGNNAGASQAIALDASNNIKTNVISSVLPTGASTSANQTTANTSLATIATNTTITSAGTTATSALPIQGVTGGVAINVQSVVPSSIKNGQQTTTLSSICLPSNALAFGNFSLQASQSNSGIVYAGASGVTSSTGYALSPGQVLNVSVNNTNQICIVGTNTTDTISYIGN